MWSFWENESFIGEPELLVIGSGIVGLSAAIEYKNLRPRAKITVIEAGHLPAGASTKNAGFACFGSPSELLMDLETQAPKPVFSLLKKRLDGLSNLKRLLGEKAMGFEAPGSFELFTVQDEESYQKCLGKLDWLNQEIEARIGFKPYVVRPNLSQKMGFQQMLAAIEVKGEGQIHTGKMMHSLIQLADSKGIRILNGLKAVSVESKPEGSRVETEAGPINCQKCLIATNGFARHLLPELDVKPARAQVLITEPIPGLKIRGTFHFDCGYYYFRNVGQRILFGGGRNLAPQTETSFDDELNPEIQDHLVKLLKSHILPDTNFKVAQRWTGIMGIGESKGAIVRQVDRNLFASIRLGGMGVAIGSLVGKEAAQLMADS